MYLNFFGLNKDPFRITPDPEFFFSGGNRGAVLEALCYAVAKGEGIVKVVGEVGSGKTMLCRMLERELPENCDIIYLANPRLSADDVLFAIAHELQLPVPENASKLVALASLQEYLLDKHANNRRVVMFIEEAQGMLIDTLEEIRMLSNLETTQEKLLQIVLFGQPEFDQKLALHEIRQLKERITYSFNLAPLNREEIRDYLYTRLRASGYRGNELFTKGAINTLARRSQGLLRRINVLADKALLAAFAQGAHKVERKHVKMAIQDSDFSRPPLRLLPIFATATLVIGIATFTWWLTSHNSFFADRGLAEVSTTNQNLSNRSHEQLIEHSSATNNFKNNTNKLDLSAADIVKASQVEELALLEKAAKSTEPGTIGVDSLSINQNSKLSPETASFESEFQMFEVLQFDTSVVSVP